LDLFMLPSIKYGKKITTPILVPGKWFALSF